MFCKLFCKRKSGSNRLNSKLCRFFYNYIFKVKYYFSNLFYIKIVLFSLFIVCFFSSCFEEKVVFSATESTVKETFDNMLKEKKWQTELESPDKYILKISEINSPLPEGTLAILPRKDIYPSYKDFGLLDTSKLENSLLKMLDAFFYKATLVAKEERIVDTKFLDPSYPFLSAIFEPFFKELPDIVQIIYGEPAFIDDVIEIPIRLNGMKNYTDLLVYVLKDNDTWYIEQIVFGEQINE